MAVCRHYKTQFVLLKPAFQPVETASQNDHVSTCKMYGNFLRRCLRFVFQSRVGRSFGIQELRVGQQIADAVIGNYFERGDVGITAEAGIFTRASPNAFRDFMIRGF